MPTSPDLSIAIIDTNNRELTLQCLEAVFAGTHRVSLEVFVVDNACMDGSAAAIAERFPLVRIISNVDRLGFSTNNNRALELAAGRYLMILNDDTEAQPGASDALVEFLDSHPRAGACGPKLLNPDGSEQQSYDFFLGPVAESLRPLSLWGKECRLSDRAMPLEVDRVIGACMVVRRETVEQVGLLDPAFDPIYSEEADWCYRIKRAGWEIWVVPGALVTHFGGQTMNRARKAAIIGLSRKKALFFSKHRGALAASVFKFCLWLASVAKMLVWLVPFCLPRTRLRARDRLWTHWQLCRHALFL